MKHGKWMNYLVVNCHRKNNLENWARRRIIVFILISVAVFTMLTTEGCRQRGMARGTSEKTVVAIEDIKIDYPDMEGQKRELQKFKNIIEAKSAVEKPDELLRRMVEHIPLEYIRAHLEELAKTASAKDKPNIFILLGRINEMYNLDYVDTSRFIKEAIDSRNADKLSVALFGLRTESQHAKVAEALALIRDPKSVRLLTMRLSWAADLCPGGAEVKLIREQLRQSLVNAIGTCTGMDFSDYDPTSDAKTFAVVKRWQDWLERNPQDN